MKQEEWKAQLDSRRGTPLCELITGVPLFKYQHVERMGSQDVEDLLDGEVIVQDKIDGANLTVTRGVIASRNRVISRYGEPNAGFKGAVEYVLSHHGIQNLLMEKKWILRGEWAIRHTLTYNTSVYGHFYVFDVQTWDGAYVHPTVYIPVLESHDIKHIRVLARLNQPSMEELTKLSNGPDNFGAKQKEGIVIKRYDFVNKYGRTVWGKIVNADFRIKNKLAFHVSGNDDIELRLAQVADTHFVLKVIDKIADGIPFDHKVTIKDMSQIIGRVWYDVIHEELWDFLKREKVDTFSFRKARKYVLATTKEIALAYFNGTLDVGEDKS